MPSALDRAKETAVAFIGLNRNRSSGKVKAKLRAAGFDADVIDEAVLYLQSIDYINDTRAAESFVKKHTGRRMKSTAVLADLLLAQGIPEPIARAVLEAGPRDEERARELLQALFPHGADKTTVYKKLVARGFHPDMAQALAVKAEAT